MEEKKIRFILFFQSILGGRFALQIDCYLFAKKSVDYILSIAETLKSVYKIHNTNNKLLKVGKSLSLFKGQAV